MARSSSMKKGKKSMLVKISDKIGELRAVKKINEKLDKLDKWEQRLHPHHNESMVERVGRGHLSKPELWVMNKLSG